VKEGVEEDLTANSEPISANQRANSGSNQGENHTSTVEFDTRIARISRTSCQIAARCQITSWRACIRYKSNHVQQGVRCNELSDFIMVGVYTDRFDTRVTTRQRVGLASSGL